MLTLQDRFPVDLRLHRFILYPRRSGGTAHEGGRCDQSIGSLVSDAIVRSWLWSTATRSSPLATLLEITFHLNAISNKNSEFYNQSKDGKQSLMHSVYFLLISVDVVSKKSGSFGFVEYKKSVRTMVENRRQL